MSKKLEGTEGDNLAIHSCGKCECDNYILYVKGERTHIRNAPIKEFIDVATLTLSDIYDLFFIADEILTLENQRKNLEKTYKKSKKNHKRRKNQ